MQRTRLDPSTVQDIRDAQAGGESIRKAAERLGVPVSTVASHWPKAGASTFGQRITRTEKGDELKIDGPFPTRIRTESDALAYAGIDLKTWYVHSMQITDWEMGWTRGSKKDRTAHVEPLHRIMLHLKRIAPRAVLEGLRLLREDLATLRPSTPVAAYQVGPGRPCLLVADLFDVHFGKLGWAPEVGESYDLEIAEARFENAVEDLLAKSIGWNIEEILFPIGNDLFHIDNRRNTTLAGTMLDVDSRYAKIWKTVKRGAIRAAERMAERAKRVRVIWVPGNHDFHPSFHLVDVIASYFRNCERLSVDETPCVRKLHQYHATLLGFQHGDTVKGSGIVSLPDQLTGDAIRAGIDLRQIRTREIHLGHRHGENTFTQKEVGEFRGCKVRWLSALSGMDFWHAENNYTGNTQAATGLIYEREEGFQSIVMAYARDRAVSKN